MFTYLFIDLSTTEGPCGLYTVGKSRYIMTYTVTESEKNKQTTEMKDIHIKQTKSQRYCELQQSILKATLKKKTMTMKNDDDISKLQRTDLKLSSTTK